MKKIIVIAIMLYSTSVFSQVKLGVKANIGGATFTGPIQDKNNNLNGDIGASFQAGGVINIGLGKILSIQSELLYSQMSSTLQKTYFTAGSTSSSNSQAIILRQIQVPIQIKVSSKRLYVMAGPYYALTLSDQKLTATDFTGSPQSNEYNKSDIGINIGAGVRITEGLSIDLKYMQGFVPIDKYGYKVTYLSLGATYLF